MSSHVGVYQNGLLEILARTSTDAESRLDQSKMFSTVINWLKIKTLIKNIPNNIN